MKKLSMALVAGMLLTGLGCKDSQKIPTQPEAINALPEVTRLAPPANRVEADDIDETNYIEMAGKLQGDVSRDHRAMTKAGRDGTDPR